MKRARACRERDHVWRWTRATPAVAARRAAGLFCVKPTSVAGRCSLRLPDRSIPLGSKGSPMLNAIRASLSCSWLLVLAGLVGCSGGGGPAAPTIDVTGYWQLFLTPDGSPDESGPSPLYLSQSGATVDGAAVTGTVSGNHFSISSVVSGLFTVRCDGTLIGNTATGTLEVSGAITATGTFRMVRFTPAGTMTATGTLSGVAVSMNTSAAIGSRSYSDVGLTVLEHVAITAAYGSQQLDIDISAAGLAAGTLAVPGTITASVSYRDDSNVLDLDADGGTVTVTTYDNNGFTGSFSLTLPGGGTLTGTFDVVWDIEAYEP
jgi:hypothetical protein